MAHDGLERRSRGRAGSRLLLPIRAERTSMMLQNVIAVEQGRCSPALGWPSGSPRCLAFGSAAYSGTRIPPR